MPVCLVQSAVDLQTQNSTYEVKLRFLSSTPITAPRIHNNQVTIPRIDFPELERSCDLQSMLGQDCGLRSNQVGGQGGKNRGRRRRGGCEINMTKAQSVAVRKERSASRAQSRAQSRGADE